MPNSHPAESSIDDDDDDDDNDDDDDDHNVDDNDNGDDSKGHHHEFTRSFQKRFHQKAKQFYEKILSHENPFEIENSNLLKLSTQDAFDPAVIESLRLLEAKGKEQYDSFVKDVLENGTRSIHDPIPKNNFPLPSTSLKRITSTSGTKAQQMQLNNDLFARLVAMMQHKKVSIDELFSFETHSFPPALSEFGNILLRPSNSEIIKELVTPCHCVQDELSIFRADYNVIFDGEKLVLQHPPKKSMTYKEYVEMIQKDVLYIYLTVHSRVDIIFDSFVDGSVKAAVEKKHDQEIRGTTARRRVAAELQCPKHWSQFLRDRSNRKEVYRFLAESLSALQYPSSRQVFITCQRAVLSNTAMTMHESNIEGAESRILLHVRHALMQGMSKIKIISNNSNLVVIALGLYHELSSTYNFEDIIVEFGMNETHKKISLKQLSSSLGQLRCQALPFFHCLTGTNLNCSFRGITKKKSYEALKAYERADEILAYLWNHPHQNISEGDMHFTVIQRLVTLFYSRTCDLTCVNEARAQLYFAQLKLESIPPTKDALLLHCKRVIYECGTWRKCLEANQQLPSPENFGWKQTNDQNVVWEPLWISGTEASKEARQLTKCTCKSEACRNCKCRKASLRCTTFCTCKCQIKIAYE